jgi:transketolase N-terminal domain/subunit
MAKSFITEDELKDFKERMQATVERAKTHGIELTSGSISYNPLQVMLALYTDRLDKSSRRLICLTRVLIILTVILAILTGISVWRIF